MDGTNDAAGAGGSKGGLGDEQGTRIGAPDPGHIRGAAHNDGATGRPERHLGAGSEPTEAVHSAKSGARKESDETGLKAQSTGTNASDDRAGSEPLVERKNEHKSGYGGEGGSPKESSDKRE